MLFMKNCFSTVKQSNREESKDQMNNSEATWQIENEAIQNVCLSGSFDQSTLNDITTDVSIPQ